MLESLYTSQKPFVQTRISGYSFKNRRHIRTFSGKEPASRQEKFETITPAQKFRTYSNSSDKDRKYRDGIMGLDLSLGALFGAIIPIFLTKSSSVTVKIISSILGAVAGALVGLTASLFTPKPDKYYGSTNPSEIHK